MLPTSKTKLDLEEEERYRSRSELGKMSQDPAEEQSPKEVAPTSHLEIQDSRMSSPNLSDNDENMDGEASAENIISQDADEFDIQGFADKAEWEKSLRMFYT